MSIGGIARGGSLFRMWQEDDEEPREETLVSICPCVLCLFGMRERLTARSRSRF